MNTYRIVRTICFATTVALFCLPLFLPRYSDQNITFLR